MNFLEHLQDLFKESGVGDFVNSLFQSASELQFTLFDPSLDQLIEGLDVERFFNSSSNLAVISFCSETR